MNQTIDYFYGTDNICKFDTVTGIPDEFRNCLESFSLLFNFDSYQEDKFSKPMPWIGIYIAVASLFCILAMVADLIHGLKSRKLWFPCKYFTLNAVSLTVIAVAMKLPVDLSNPMRGVADQDAKLGSMAFMCIMMANLLPSLATMNSKELLTNIIALDILVITLIVNVCIQIYTDVIGDLHDFYPIFKGLALLYVIMLLILLIIHTCSGLTILRSKQMIELKYQAAHETALEDLGNLQQPETYFKDRSLAAEKLKQHVKNHWIMAGTGSPQFITACSATTSASGVICVASTYLHVHSLSMSIFSNELQDFRSDYKGSIPVILIIQSIGCLLGTIAPLCRCFAAMTFKLSINWIWNHIKVFNVESYWTQKLYDWKQSSIPFSVSSRKIKIVIHHIKVIFLIICIGLQKTVVVACKMIALIPIFFVICVLFCIRCWKWFKDLFSDSSIVRQRPDNFQDLRPYVLHLQDDMELSERTLKSISESLNRLIKKAQNQPPNYLVKLLRNSRDFKGVKNFDSLPVQSSPESNCTKCWSLPVVTLATIALSLRRVQYSTLKNFLKEVSEGLVYVKLVEKSLNNQDELVRVQEAAERLWLDVEVKHKWSGNNLQDPHFGDKTAKQIVEWFKDKATNMETEVGSATEIWANSMRRVTQTLINIDEPSQERGTNINEERHTNIDERDVSQETLFRELSSMIADILAACLTNLPQVIVTKCHESAIEKRGESVHAAATLFGKTSVIINALQGHVLPSLTPEEFPFIDKWRDHRTAPAP